MSRHSEDTSTLIKTDNILSALDSMLGILQADNQVLYYSDSVVENERTMVRTLVCKFDADFLAVRLMKSNNLDILIPECHQVQSTGSTRCNESS